MYKNRALQMRRTVLGEGHPDVAQSLNYVASAYVKVGRWQEALEYELQALDVLQDFHQNDHPQTAV